MKLKFLTIALTYLMLIGCVDKKENTYYDDGKLKCFFYVKDGYKNGESRCFYLSGKLKSIEWYNHGKLDGHSEEYYENGNLKLKARWNYGVIEGYAEQYYSNGNLFTKTLYRNGIKTGDVFVFHTNGKLANRQIADSLGNVIYSINWNESGIKNISKVNPIIKIDSDTITIADACHISVSFGYKLSGELNMNFEGLDSLSAPEIESNRNGNTFLFNLKFKESGLHSFAITADHQPVAGDTLSADKAGQIIKILVKPLING